MLSADIDAAFNRAVRDANPFEARLDNGFVVFVPPEEEEADVWTVIVHEPGARNVTNHVRERYLGLDNIDRLAVKTIESLCEVYYRRDAQ